MTRHPFVRPIDLPGWSQRSAWGYDERLESYWAELHQDSDGADGPAISIVADHLMVTITSLSAVIAERADLNRDEAYLGLVGRSRTAQQATRPTGGAP
ncbi:hypothetical protein [Cellulomonas fimi]|uniref:Uncharacterized protein n=1 Tax=Cellulomonas fimi TaxID=1708 RepID=A0A7Y0QHH2_CELFI|nr:hypothetical protein [Cellulomonas fimi]NMR21151.1 hypothetical protein [Cellulomonas fimi]